jgi:hypothetical protein
MGRGRGVQAVAGRGGRGIWVEGWIRGKGEREKGGRREEGGDSCVQLQLWHIAV